MGVVPWHCVLTKGQLGPHGGGAALAVDTPAFGEGLHDLQAAADILNAGKKVAILVGAGALGATDEVIAVADRLQAGAAKALLGKAALPDDLPWVTGSIGLLGTKTSSDMMGKCDTLLMVGTNFLFADWLPEEGAGALVGDPAEAAEEFSAVAEKAPTDDYALFCLGRSLQQLGRHAEARKALAQASHLRPDRADYRLYRQRAERYA